MVENILIGALIAVASIWILRSKDLDKEVKSWGIALTIAGLVYVAFALNVLMGEWILIEIVATLFCILFYYIGIKHSSYFIAIGWGAHVFWDYYIHMKLDPGYAPDWYPHFCIGFDLLVAAYLIYLIMLPSKKHPQIATKQ